jgi:enoyl-CoA hydratase/carnithine racemase
LGEGNARGRAISDADTGAPAILDADTGAPARNAFGALVGLASGFAVADAEAIANTRKGFRSLRESAMSTLNPTQTEITVERDGEVAVITMNRQERRNALSLRMMRELDGALAALARDADARVVILRATGPAFSAGHDLRELFDRDAEAYREIFDACVRLMARITDIPAPVVAEVAGVATAAGCQLVAACDLAIASTQATFATPGVRIGLFCSTPMVALSRAIGRKRAMEMLLTGEPIDARTALDWGLVNHVVAPERLHEETLSLARRIASASATIVGIGKAAFYKQIDIDQASAYEYTKDVMTRNALEADAREGIGAFLEKRAPKW